jgi:hypothetical protein
MATGALAPLPLQWFDNAGAPLAGGSLTWTLAGTTTATPVYSNIDLAVGHLHSAPVVLDSSGRATVYLVRGIGYRVVVKDSAGVTVETIDPVIAYDDTYTPPTWAQVPTGVVLPYGGSAAPTGYLLADGTAVSRTTYAALFGVIGTAYGVGDASTTFNVPNLCGRYPFGKGASAVSTPVDPTLATNQSGTDLAAGTYKVAIVGVAANGAVSLPSSSVSQAVGAGGAGRIVVTYTLPTGASKVRVYVTTMGGTTPDRYFDATASPFNINTLTGAVVGALPAAATVTGATLGATFGTIDHVHLGASHTHGMTGSTANDATCAVTGSTATDGGGGAVTGNTGDATADLDLTKSGFQTSGSDALTDAHDDGHWHPAGTLAIPAHGHAAGTLTVPNHPHAAGTLSATAEGVRESAASNPASVVVNYIIKT